MDVRQGRSGVYAITGGTISGVTGVPKFLGNSNIPFISLSSGSVAANGAISAITALPRIYTDAYCYFPANILATVKAAGWYYCTFSSTTAGTAFLDTYTSGAPTVPASPAPVTDGKGAFTGDTGEEFGPTFTVAANLLGANGAIRIMGSNEETNNANLKTIRFRFSGNAGTVFLIPNATSLASNQFTGGIQNFTSAKQLSVFYGPATGWNTALVSGTVDTTAATTIVTSLQKATATDNIVLLPTLYEVVN
jgi:hypothetical protein